MGGAFLGLLDRGLGSSTPAASERPEAQRPTSRRPCFRRKPEFWVLRNPSAEDEVPKVIPAPGPSPGGLPRPGAAWLESLGLSNCVDLSRLGNRGPGRHGQAQATAWRPCSTT